MPSGALIIDVQNEVLVENKQQLIFYTNIFYSFVEFDFKLSDVLTNFR